MKNGDLKRTKLVAAMGATADIKIDVGYPFVLNNEALTMHARKQAEVFVGAENISETELRMGAEDFAYYSHKIPGCFFRLGVGNLEKDIKQQVHTSRFRVDEDAIEQGIGMMAWLAVTG